MRRGSACGVPGQQWTPPGGERLARTGRGVDQAAQAVQVGLPDSALKIEDVPAAALKPRFRELHAAAASGRDAVTACLLHAPSLYLSRCQFRCQFHRAAAPGWLLAYPPPLPVYRAASAKCVENGLQSQTCGAMNAGYPQKPAQTPAPVLPNVQGQSVLPYFVARRRPPPGSLHPSGLNKLWRMVRARGFHSTPQKYNPCIASARLPEPRWA